MTTHARPQRFRSLPGHSTAFGLFCLGILFGAPVYARAQNYGPDTCKQGFVWREAYPGDHVCVTPPVRAQAAEDNRQASSRRSPTDRAYGPHTCRQGFVWREARPGDHTCVTPETRAQAVADNRGAPSRYVSGSNRSLTSEAARRLAPSPGVAVSSVPPAVGARAKRGFDETGQPYVEERLADGTIKRTQQNGVTLIKPGGTKQFIPFSYTRSNAQPPTPPELPGDPKRGRAWVERHNEALLGVITVLVHGDDAEMKKFGEGERKAVGDDLFAQIAYRTRVAEFLAQER